MTTPDRGWSLGLDLGTNSLGWAAVKLDADAQPCAIMALGARIFDAGYLIEKSKESSVAAPRREARHARRQTERRMRRNRRLFRALQRAGLLPDGGSKTPGERHAVLVSLDSRLRSVHAECGLLGPYFLRARALDHRLDPHDLGRALYHLAQRRGYWRLKGAPLEEDEMPLRGDEEVETRPRKPMRPKKLGKVDGGIAKLRADLLASGKRTVGEYLASLNPHAERIRGPQRYTSRRMVFDEFNAIWESQAPHHPGRLTVPLRRQIKHIIFSQRPLRSTREFIGACEFEPGQQRAPKALIAAQRFRMLQRMNDLRVIEPGRSARNLDPPERAKVLAHLEMTGDARVSRIIEDVLGMPEGTRLNLGDGAPAEASIKGDRTSAKLARSLGIEFWSQRSSAQREALVEALLTIPTERAIERHGRRAWDMDEAQAKKFAAIEPEPGHLGISRRALRKLVPRLEAGEPYMTAARATYPQHFMPRDPVRELPPVAQWQADIRNPVVTRALTELRHVVNALIRKYGKPALVRVELARDLKRSRKDRVEMRWETGRRERERETARTLIREVRGIPVDAYLSALDTEKALLLKELGEPAQCPYCGRAISPIDALTDEATCEVDHIIPFSRCLDDSLGNKVLACRDCNQRKGRRAPREAFGDTPAWEGIVARIRRWGQDGDARRGKHRRFHMSKDQIDEARDAFTARQLNDTRYASRLSREYLSLLFGGLWDEEGSRRVSATAGQATAYFRNGWSLNGLLSDGPRKTRDDHRHHAVDALVVALTSERQLQGLGMEASRLEGRQERRQLLRKALTLAPPWQGFAEDARAAVDNIVVSSRVRRRIRGKLHADTNYRPDGSLRRKPNSKTSVVVVGDAERKRWVAPASNHHVVVFEATDRRGKTTWKLGQPVTTLEAHRRKSSGGAVVRRDIDGGRFLFSLCKGDVVRATKLEGEPLLIVESVSDRDLQCWPLASAIAIAERTKEARNDWRYRSGSRMQADGWEKVEITVLGDRVSVAHD